MGIKSNTVVLASAVRDTVQSEIIPVPADAVAVTFVLDCTDATGTSVTATFNGSDGGGTFVCPLLVEAAVTAIDIAEEVGGDHGVVQRRVEHRALGVAAALDLDLAMCVTPLLAGRLPDALEIPPRLLGVEVSTRAIDVDGRDADLHQQLTAAIVE